MPFIPRSNPYGAWQEEDTENVKNTVKAVVRSPISLFNYILKDIGKEHREEELRKQEAVKYWNKNNHDSE